MSTHNTKSRSHSDVDRTFVAATMEVFENCETLDDLHGVGERLAADGIATRAEKRLLRTHYVKMRQYLTELEDDQ